MKSKRRELAVCDSPRVLPKVAGAQLEAPSIWERGNLYCQCRSRAAASSLAFSAVPEPIMSARESANGLLEA